MTSDAHDRPGPERKRVPGDRPNPFLLSNTHYPYARHACVHGTPLKYCNREKDLMDSKEERNMDLRRLFGRSTDDNDEHDRKARAYENFRKDISSFEGKRYYDLDEDQRYKAKYMVMMGFLEYRPETGIDQRLAITRLGREKMERK